MSTSGKTCKAADAYPVIAAPPRGSCVLWLPSRVLGSSVGAAMKQAGLAIGLVALWLGAMSCNDDSDPGQDDQACVGGRCGSRKLTVNPYCGSDCQRLEELSQGCIGSHTEQECVACGTTYIRVGGDDASTPFYNARGEMVAIQIIGEGDAACADAWFGIDLSECVRTGEVRQVLCDSHGP